MKVHVYNIRYCIDEKDFDDYQEYYYTLEKLQKELTLEISVEEGEDEDEIIADAISDETGWLIASFEYSIIE